MFGGTFIVVFTTCAILVMARAPPTIENFSLFNENSIIDSRYSTDVYEDANLNVPDLIRKYKYPVEVHNMTTSDGYILQMHRIPHGRDSNTSGKNKPVVILMHGILCSSSIWVLTGPGAGLGYILAEEGYDVWMGNTRGSTYSRRHTYLNPDAILNTAYWNFSWDEMGNYDLPTMIDYVLKQTGKRKLHYIGHSQGTTTFFVMTSLRPAYNSKIISMQALAPVAFMAHNTNPLLLAMAPFANDIEAIGSLVGIGEFLPHSVIFNWAGAALCKDQVVTQSICSNILFLVGGWDEAQLNKTMLPTIYGQLPAGASVRELVHYGQGINGKQFRRYDHGTILGNIAAYGTISPPKYDLSKIVAPVFLHYADNDPLSHVQDVWTLFKGLGKPMGMFHVPLPNFTHTDYMWAIDVKKLVYNRVIRLMASMN